MAFKSKAGSPIRKQAEKKGMTEMGKSEETPMTTDKIPIVGNVQVGAGEYEDHYNSVETGGNQQKIASPMKGGKS